MIIEVAYLGGRNMDFLTSSILSGIAWDGIKKFGIITGEFIKNGLNDRVLDEKTCEKIAYNLNNMPVEYKKSQKFLEAAIDDDKELQGILKEAMKTHTFLQGSIGSINHSNVINGMNNTVTSTVNNYNSYDKKEAEIKIIDIEIDEKSNKFPVLDIKLRNTGDEVAFLKKINFNVTDYFEMINPQITNYNRVESSHTYDVLLSGSERKSYPISQSLSPNGVDRFKIILANTFGDPIMPAIYRFNISIIYNENNRSIESEEMIIPIPSTEDWLGSYVSDFSKENAKNNYFSLHKFSQFNFKKSGYFISILESYEKNKSDFL